MRARAQSAIFFNDESYHMEQKALVGRQAAGNAFLRGLVRHTHFTEIVAVNYSSNPSDAWNKALQTESAIRPVRYISPTDMHALTQVGCVFFPGPNFERFAYLRMSHDIRSFSLCGVTHTTASCLDVFAALPVIPLFSWDALICTSKAVRDTLRTILEDATAYYAWRFGNGRTALPQLPLIPLGVMTDDYVIAEEDRIKARHALNATADDTVVLFLGRLSFHGKANPAAMFMALEESAQVTQKPITLILCGWFSDDLQKNAFHEGAKQLAPSVRIVLTDGRDSSARKFSWAAADIFCSLSDNIQETFGLTPLEGMAAGLPVVVTDWDGYRDTVRDGIDGFRIRTTTLAASSDTGLALQFASGALSYGQYILQTSQVTTLDLSDCVKAISSLIQSPELRKKMGSAGRKRACEIFDWQHIIQQYEELWAELEERRRADFEPTAMKVPHNMPSYPDPFHAFESYPSEVLTDAHLVILRVTDPVKELTTRSKLVLFEQGAALCLSMSTILEIVELLQLIGVTTVKGLSDHLAPDIRNKLKQSLLWCSKMGIVQVHSPTSPV